MTVKRLRNQSFLRQMDALPPLLRFGLTVLTVVIAAIATRTIPVIGERAALLLFFFTIIQTAFWLGFNSSILATILSLIAVNTFVLIPVSIEPYDLIVLNAGFCFVSTAMIATTSLYRRSNMALWEKQQDLDFAQTVGKIGSWRLNVQRNELLWSDENHQIFGIPKGTPLTYETFLKTVHPDDRDYVNRMWQAGLRGEPYDIEHRLIVAGSVKWVRERAVLEFSKKGSLQGGFGITQDITDRKRNELLLMESRQRYAEIVESAMDAIITFDADQRILLFNPAAEKMFGCSVTEAVGTSIEQFIPEWFNKAHDMPFRTIEDSGITKRKDELLAVSGLRFNGEEFPIEVSISQYEQDGQLSFTAILRDMTERMREESALKEQLRLRDQLVKVAAAVPGLICSFRLRPDGTASMPFASPAFQSVYGVSHDTVAEDFGPIFARIHPDDIGQIHDTIAESARTMQPWQDWFRYNHPTKGEIWIEGHSVPLREADGSILWHGYIQDITRGKKAELERQKFISLADNSKEFIGMCDMNFFPFYVNAAGMRLVGLNSLAEALQVPVREFFFPEDQRFITEEFFPRVFREGNAEVEIRFRHFRTGAAIWMIYNVFYIKDYNGDPAGLATVSRDITARKRAEQKIALLNQNLQRRIEEMQVIFDTAPIGLCIAEDAMGYHIRDNPTNERMLGLAPGSELSKRGDAPAAICVLQNGRELVVDELPMQRAIRGEAVTNQIMDIVRPDGQVIKVLSNASPLYNEEGVTRGAVGAFLDITELKRVEESLQKSQTQLRLFIEQAPLSIAMFDREMNYLVTSRRWIEEFGRGYADVTGRNYYDVHPDISAEWKQIHRKAQAGEFLENENDLWIQADGSRHWLRWAACPWTDQEGETGGIIISCEDITARCLAEEELRKTEARLALVVEEVKAGYWDWDLKTNTVYLSPEWKRQIGFDENELLNRWEEWECRLHPDDRNLVLAATKNYIAGLQPAFESEFRLLHKDGSYRWIHSRGGLLCDPYNHPYRMLGINLDITDYKKAKELKERRDGMEQSFRFHVAFQTAAAIAHELNQPLTAISSYADVALHMLQTSNTNSQKLSDVLEKCALQAQRAGQVIRQLMTLLQKGETISEPIDINISINETLEFIKEEDRFGDFEIEPVLAAGLPKVTANNLQIQKVLINLLQNGLESMQESGIGSGVLTVTTRRSFSTPSMVQVTVCDCGKGVADTGFLKTMFNPFYSTKATGLGMGLAISRALIEAHGGKMWAEQNADTGISVHFTLPFVI